MNTKTYWPRRFEVKDGTPVLTNGNHDRLEAQTIINTSKDDDNIWDADIKLDIFATKEGIGLRYEVPDGYSSYTYAPEVTEKFYKGASLVWFLSQGLDQDQRDMLDQSDINYLTEQLNKIQGDSSEQQT